MKTLLLISTLILGSAFAGTDSTQAHINKKTGDLSISIKGEKAKELFHNLDVTAQPGLGTATIKTSFKVNENIKCQAVNKSQTFFGHIKSSFKKSQYEKWIECSSSIGSADPDAVEKICGKKPELVDTTKYSCLIKLDKDGKAYLAK